MDEEGGVRRTNWGDDDDDDEAMTSLTTSSSEHETENAGIGLNRHRDDEEEDESDQEDGDERTGFLRDPPGRELQHQSSGRGLSSSRLKKGSSSKQSSTHRRQSPPLGGDAVWYKTLLPDTGLTIRGHRILEASGMATKFLKLIVWTFMMIGVVHIIVAHLFDDRDQVLKISHIWRYESDLIVRDMMVFFVVGRLWEKPGIDHLAWMGTAVLSNIYFESQNFLWFLQHSVSLFEMHCLWPWELWMFAVGCIVVAIGLVGAHALYAWRRQQVVAKLTEVALCILLFMAPMVTSNYFHLHHWYAGWLMGMQFNYDVW